MMNKHTYTHAFGDPRYRGAKTYDELLFVYIEDIESASEQFDGYLFNHTKKHIPENDDDLALKHKTATTIERLLDSALNQLTSNILNLEEADYYREEYKKRKRGEQLPDTELNRVSVKLNNSLFILEAFKGRHRLIVKNHYFYQDYYLYIGPENRIRFRPMSDHDQILRLLFQSPDKKVPTEELLQILASTRPVTTDASLLAALRSICGRINRRVRDVTRNDVKLISCGKQFTVLDVNLFDNIRAK